jgi:hypothetical protein
VESHPCRSRVFLDQGCIWRQGWGTRTLRNFLRSTLYIGGKDGHPATAIASVSDCVCRGNRRLPQFDAPATRRRCYMESGARLRGGGSDKQPGIAVDVPRPPQPWLRSPRRNDPLALDGFCHTTHGLPADPHSPLESRRLGVSRLLKQARPDLLPRNDIGGVLLMPGDAVVKLRPLRIRQGCGIRFQAFPDRIQQVGLLRCREVVDLASQVVHMLINLARFICSCKRKTLEG